MRGEGSVYLQKNCSIWRAQYYVGGRKVVESTGARDRDGALAFLKNRLESLPAQPPPVQVKRYRLNCDELVPDDDGEYVTFKNYMKLYRKLVSQK